MNPLLENHFQKQQNEIKTWYLSLKHSSNLFYESLQRLNGSLPGRRRTVPPGSASSMPAEDLMSTPKSASSLNPFPSQQKKASSSTPQSGIGSPSIFSPSNTEHITVQDLINTLEYEHGIRIQDCPELRRLLESMGFTESTADFSNIPLSFRDFFQLVGSDDADENIIKRAFTGRLAIPNWKDFCRQMRKIYKIVLRNEAGCNASYIPQLAEVDSNLFGVSLVTVDGQRLSIGDSKHEFTIQSCSKIFTYCIASEDVGSEQLHRHIGYEPSGKSFNAFTLDHNRKPHNPLINSGAITTCSLIRPSESATSRFNFIQNQFSAFAGGAKISFDNATFLSERDTADRNFALAHYMKENNVFPLESKLDETLDLYFQACSILVNSETLAVMASTLANGGTCPTTNRRVSSPQTVKNILQLAYSCGMYDFSGEWSVSVGLPAKSGVAGAIAVVVPGVMGLSVFSPRLDKRGNTVRGVDFCIRANKIYKWAIFDRLVKTGVDEDPNEDMGEHDVDHVEGHEEEDYMVPNAAHREPLPHREGDRPPPSAPIHYGHGGAEAGQNMYSHTEKNASTGNPSPERMADISPRNATHNGTPQESRYESTGREEPSRNNGTGMQQDAIQNPNPFQHLTVDPHAQPQHPPSVSPPPASFNIRPSDTREQNVSHSIQQQQQNTSRPSSSNESHLQTSHSDQVGGDLNHSNTAIASSTEPDQQDAYRTDEQMNRQVSQDKGRFTTTLNHENRLENTMTVLEPRNESNLQDESTVYTRASPERSAPHEQQRETSDSNRLDNSSHYSVSRTPASPSREREHHHHKEGRSTSHPNDERNIDHARRTGRSRSRDASSSRPLSSRRSRPSSAQRAPSHSHYSHDESRNRRDSYYNSYPDESHSPDRRRSRSRQAPTVESHQAFRSPEEYDSRRRGTFSGSERQRFTHARDEHPRRASIGSEHDRFSRRNYRESPLTTHSSMSPRSFSNEFQYHQSHSLNDERHHESTRRYSARGSHEHTASRSTGGRHSAAGSDSHADYSRRRSGTKRRPAPLTPLVPRNDNEAFGGEYEHGRPYKRARH